jgi:hypothetical protein
MQFQLEKMKDFEIIGKFSANLEVKKVNFDDIIRIR